MAPRARAEQANHPQIEPEHLLVALVEQPGGVVPGSAAQAEVDPARGRPRRAQRAGQAAQGARRRRAGFSPRLRLVIDCGAGRSRAACKDEYVSTEHLLLAHRQRRRPVARRRSCCSGTA